MWPERVVVEPEKAVVQDARDPSSRRSPPEPPPRARGTPARTALMLLPGASIVYLGFNAGGYFPASSAFAAVVVAQLLLVRIVRSPQPFEGLTRSALVAIGALALYGLLTLLSALWSHASGRALIEFDRALLYLLTLVLFATIRPSGRELRLFVRGLLAGIAVVCLAGLISRVLPHVWHTAPNVANQRLSYPVTYWNTLGLLAAVGIVLAFHLTCSLHERRVARSLAAALVPLLAATLFFTFSRGAMAAGAVGLVAYVLVGRPRALLSGALATGPSTAALVLVAYHANLLDTVDPTTPAAVAQGGHVALAAAICSALSGGLRLLLAATLDPRLRGLLGARRMSARTGRLAGGAVALGVVLGALALGLPNTISHDWSRFIGGAATNASSGDLRQRLSDPSNDGRTELWQAALHGFSASPLHGEGAGMYQTVWDQRRPRFAFVIDAHSLYLQALAELGIPGLLLLLVLIDTVLMALVVRARGSRRSLYGALFAVALVWALRAGIDWDWEMPVVTLPFFALAGLALSPRPGTGPGSASPSTSGSAPSLRWPASWRPGRGVRAGLAALCLAAAVPLVLTIGSQVRLEHAERALYASNCATAGPAAQSSIGWLGMRPQPYEILGLCDIQRSLPQRALAAMHEAERLDPGSWETHYALALAQAAARIDPRPSAAKALRMNPFEPLTREAAKEFRGSSPAGWAKQARAVRAAALASNDLSIVPS